MYTIRFYRRGSAAPVRIISARTLEEIMRDLDDNFPGAANVYLDCRADGVRVYFDAPAEAKAA